MARVTFCLELATDDQGRAFCKAKSSLLVNLMNTFRHKEVEVVIFLS